MSNDNITKNSNTTRTDLWNNTHKEYRIIAENNIDENGAEILIHYGNYNGPSIAEHVAKKLMIPIVNKPLFSRDDNENPINYDQLESQFCSLHTGFLLREFHDSLLFSTSTECKTGVLDQYEYNLSAKLGISYFHGKSFNWNVDFSFVDIHEVLKGNTKGIANIQKNSQLHSCFNTNKPIECINIFENKLYTRSYRLVREEKLYTLRLEDKKTNNSIIFELDSDFKIVKAMIDSLKLFSIDILRDKNKSFFKIPGTFLDIFDIRFQLNKCKLLTKKEYKEYLGVDDESVFKNLLKRSESGNELILNNDVPLKVGYLREVTSKIYQFPQLSKTSTLSQFVSNFTIRIQNIIEYGKYFADKSEEKIYRKILLSNPTVECKFDFNNWIENNKLNFENELENSIKSNSIYLFKELMFLSDVAFNCSNNWKVKGNSNKSWIHSQIKNGREKKHGEKITLKYAFNDKLIDYENLAIIKRILYSKNFLDIFGFGINTNFHDDSIQSTLHNEYNKMIRELFSDTNKYEENIDGNEKDISTSVEEIQTNGVVKLAYKKLIDAYNTLKVPVLCEQYIINLRSQRKYKKQS